MVHDKVSFTKDQSFWKSQNHFDKEYSFKLMKFMPEIIKAVRGEEIKYEFGSIFYIF